MKDNSKLLDEGWFDRKLFVVLVVAYTAHPEVLYLKPLVVPTPRHHATHPTDMLLIVRHLLS